MLDVFYNVLSFILIIALGIFVRHKKILAEGAIDTLSFVVVNITLPALILGNANAITLDINAVYLILIGVCANLFMLTLGYIRSRKREKMMVSTYMMSFASYNIGNFITPLVTMLFPPIGLVFISLFDIGSSVMTMGFNYVITQTVIHRDEGVSIRSIGNTLEIYQFNGLCYYLFMCIIQYNYSIFHY